MSYKVLLGVTIWDKEKVGSRFYASGTTQSEPRFQYRRHFSFSVIVPELEFQKLALHYAEDWCVSENLSSGTFKMYLETEKSEFLDREGKVVNAETVTTWCQQALIRAGFVLTDAQGNVLS